MELNETIKYRHHGRIKQILLCLETQLRAFIFMDDWKVIPMSAIVAAMVAYVTARNMFVSMEGTLKGALALSCICVWNGFFNSIQLVCRERSILKREHRNGMFISSYVIAHMITQAMVCAIQTLVTLIVCKLGGMNFPSEGFRGGSMILQMATTLFIITYASDMLSLLISCIAKSTTDAMTAMPFLLIFELVFSDVIFSVGTRMKPLTNLSFAKWGVRGICALSNYNSLPMTSAWNMLEKMRSFEVYGLTPVDTVMTYITETDQVDAFNLMMGSYNQVEEFATTAHTIFNCWYALTLFALVLGVLCMVVLKQIDKDKR